MGDICRMNDANRTAAVCEQDETFLDGLKRYIGATIEFVALSVNDPIGSISAAFSVRLPNGEVETLAGPLLAEVSESGVLGFELQEQYDEGELRLLLTAAIADADNGLDDRDRDAMRDELQGLPEYYGG